MLKFWTVLSGKGEVDMRSSIYFIGLFLSIFGVLCSCAPSTRSTKPSVELASEVSFRGGIKADYEVKGRFIYRFFCKESENKSMCEDFDVMSLDSFLLKFYSLDEVDEFLRVRDEKINLKKNEKELAALKKSYQEITESGKKISDRLLKDYEKKVKNLEDSIKKISQENSSKIYGNILERLEDDNFLEANFLPQYGNLLVHHFSTGFLRLDGKFVYWGGRQVGNVQTLETFFNQLRNESGIKYPIKNIAASQYHMCVIDSLNLLFCVSAGSEWNELKKRNEVDLNTIKYKKLFSGDNEICMQQVDGKLDCLIAKDSPHKEALEVLQRDLDFLRDLQFLSFGLFHLCAQTSKGAFKCDWGTTKDTLRINSYFSQNPEELPVKSIDTSYHSSCVITQKGAARCFGKMEWFNNFYKQSLVENKIIEPIKHLAMHDDDASICLVDHSDAIFCNSNAEEKLVGNRSGLNRTDYKKPILALVVGRSQICAVALNREVFCWGVNESGAVNGLDKNGYKMGEFSPEDTRLGLGELGYFDE